MLFLHGFFAAKRRLTPFLCVFTRFFLAFLHIQEAEKGKIFSPESAFPGLPTSLVRPGETVAGSGNNEELAC